MNLVSNQRSETLVNQLVPCQWPLALELGGNDERLEVVIIIARDPDNRAVQAGGNEFFDFGRFHERDQAAVARGAQCKPLA